MKASALLLPCLVNFFYVLCVTCNGCALGPCERPLLLATVTFLFVGRSCVLRRGLLAVFPMCGNYFGLFSLLQLDGLPPVRHTSPTVCAVQGRTKVLVALVQNSNGGPITIL